MSIYIVYQTQNIINNKIYIGIHKQKKNFSETEFDGYLGSGKLLKQAIEKYGKKSFKRITLFSSSDVEEVKNKEIELVNEDFLKRDDSYNLIKGGGVPPINDWTTKKHSDKSKELISISRTGKCTGAFHWSNKPENKEKWDSLVTNNSKRIRIDNIINPPALGHTVTKEQRINSSNYNKNLRWYKNMETNECVFSIECPEGFIPGRFYSRKSSK